MGIHEAPDTDSLLCLYLAETYLPQSRGAEVVLLKKGTVVSNPAPDELFFDVGGGRFDHHNNGLRGRDTCAAMLLAEALGLENSPEMKALLQLALDADQANEIPVTSIHYQVTALVRKYKDAQPGTSEWQTLIERVFEMFENVRSHEAYMARKRAEFANPRNSIKKMVGDLRVCILFNRTDLRNPAFEDGADVVIWTTKNGESLVAGVQIGRESRDRVKLHMVAAELRRAEAGIRGININGHNLTYKGKMTPCPTWYLDDSLMFVLGRRESETTTDTDDFTKLTPWDIVNAVERGLLWKPIR